MSKHLRIIFISMIVLLILSLTVYAVSPKGKARAIWGGIKSNGGVIKAAPSSVKPNFVAHLSGDQEVPPVDTDAQGQAIFRLSKDGTELYYKLIVANIEDVKLSHIHMAALGENGPVVAFLYSGPDINGRTDGILAEGTIDADDLIGPLAGEELSVLIDAIRAGNTYVNVHTTANSSGEVRGQIH